MDTEITYGQAAKLLGVTAGTLSSIIARKGWASRGHPLDRRKRLLLSADVERLLAERPKVPA